MKMYRRGKQNISNGFTLVEMLVYIALLGLISTALITTFLSLDTTLVRNKTERALTHNANVAIEHMLHNIRKSDDVVDATGSTLEIDGLYGTNRYLLFDNQIIFESDTGATSTLTSNNVTVKELNFDHYIGDNTDLVVIEMTLTYVTKAASSTRTYNISTVLRGTYE
jgi:prepilin-type N-terminal cleavage/methylation domain-containing protein